MLSLQSSHLINVVRQWEILGLVMLAGPALGPTIAGLILDTLSWEWIFWVTVPFLLFSLIFGIKFLPNVNEVRKVSIDALSVVLSTLGFGGIVYGFSVAGEYGWSSTLVLTAIIVGVIAYYLILRSTNNNEKSNVKLKSLQISHYSFLGL